ncbi:MAG TPA: hypothetical protein VK421_07395 [Pyrinomonadaceae bacterium]|nr:hypothetical protein [Pyrinomonadaceae bacterium]
MNRRPAGKFTDAPTRALLALLLFAQLCALPARAQSTPAAEGPTPAAEVRANGAPAVRSLFRLERTQVDGGGAELLTIFGESGAASGPNDAHAGNARELPLVSILRDTLGDADRENDRLRYVWTHTYAAPSARQRAASAVPFLYTRVGSRGRAAEGVPPHVLDLSAPERDAWRNVFWSSLQFLLIDPVGVAVKASSRQYRRNVEDYRRAHVIRALAVLAIYEAEAGEGAEPIFTPQETREIQARLALTQKSLGGLIDDLYLRRVHEREATKWEDTRGHNWEMLRQRAEAEGLHFEPLTMPDGAATHALLWTTREDLTAAPARKFDKRFLNIDSPWGDRRLRDWRGYTEERFFDSENRRVAEDAPGARRAEMIPLALYGLDHPRVPALLVDFRDTLNPKGREVSRRALKDVTSTLFSASRLGLAHTLGRAVYDWMTERRGMDVNQPSRLRAYSQLKLLLSLDASLDPGLREQIGRQLEHVSLNPLENGGAAEARLAREQYAALLEYARRPGGLSARLDRDRRAELVPARHGRASRVLFRLANTLSFGLYTHREDVAPAEQVAELDAERRLARHRRLLREVAKTASRVEVEWDIEEVRRSLRYVAEHGERADGATAAAVARIFARTEDEESRRLCLSGLYRINNETAKNSLVRIFRDEAAGDVWRTLSADYLRRAAREEQRISPKDAQIISTIGGHE